MAVERSRNPDVDPLLRTGLAAASSDSATGCPDAGTLAAWFEHTLPAADGARLEAHVAGCARCQAIVAALADTDSEAAAAATPVIPLRRPHAWKWIVPATIAAAAALIWAIVPNRETPVPQTQMARVEPDAGPATAPPPAPVPIGGGGGATPAPAASPAPRAEKAAAAARSAAPDGNTADMSAAPQDSGARGETASPSTVVMRAPAEFQTAAAPPPPRPSAAPGRGPEPAAAPPPSVTVVAGAPILDPSVQVRASAEPAEVQVRASNFSSALLEVTSRPSTPNAQAPAGASPQPAGRGGPAGGGRGGAANRSLLQEISAPTETRWRVSNNTTVQRSFNGGRSWDVIPVDPSARILAGDAPTPSICWFTGADGLVLVTTDATRFTRIPFPERMNLTSVTATSATEAVVGTSDGRVFRTSDAGRTWSGN